MNSGSTGRIAEDIGSVLLARADESYIAFGRGNRPSASQLVKIGSQKDVVSHGLKTILFDRHGFGSGPATKRLLKSVREIKPDIIHLHNAHGYYLNIEVLFNFLTHSKIPIVCTLHDSWMYTGHCTFYESVSCTKWQTECHHCPKTAFYPSSYLLDQSRKNFNDKRRLYSGLKNLHLVAPSKWLAGEVKKSFLKDRSLQVIHNGIDTTVFQPKEIIPEILRDINKKVILGVASIWDQRKGLEDFKKLNLILPAEYQIVLIGLSNKQLKELPASIIGLTRTESVNELADYYSAAEVFVNPTWQDNFPTTNIEALACGTPVVTYRTGGSPEAIDENTGRVVDKGDISGLLNAIRELNELPRPMLRINCQERAKRMFKKEERYLEYLNLYSSLYQ